MRLVTIFSFVCVCIAGFSQDKAAEARAEPLLGRAVCVKLALEKKGLEDTGIDAYLKQAPTAVLASQGQATVEKVRQYIGLREKVLFRCPRNVLNAAAAPIEQRAKMKPPLPAKGPKRAVRLRQPKRLVVPLPVQRRSSFRLPTSQG